MKKSLLRRRRRTTNDVIWFVSHFNFRRGFEQFRWVTSSRLYRFRSRKSFSLGEWCLRRLCVDGTYRFRYGRPHRRHRRRRRRHRRHPRAPLLLRPPSCTLVWVFEK